MVTKLYQDYDTDKDGKFSKEELKNAVKSRGDKISDSEVKTVFYYMDTNKDGKISMVEMLKSDIALQYQEGKLGKLPVIVEEPKKEKGTAWYGPVLIIASLTFAVWYVFTELKKKKGSI